MTYRPQRHRSRRARKAARWARRRPRLFWEMTEAEQNMVHTVADHQLQWSTGHQNRVDALEAIRDYVIGMAEDAASHRAANDPFQDVHIYAVTCAYLMGQQNAIAYVMLVNPNLEP